MQYTPFLTDIELPFYTSLASLKIDTDKLNVSARKVLGLYQIRTNDSPEASCRMQIHGHALTRDEAEGMIKNVNTLEDYRNEDKNALLQQAARTMWDAINDGTIYSCPSLLVSFVVISFADLKKYKFWYWFGYPAFHSSPNWTPIPWCDCESSSPTTTAAAAAAAAAAATTDTTTTTITRNSAQNHFNKHLTSEESTTLVDAVSTWRYSVDSREHGFFLAKKCHRSSSTCARPMSTLSKRSGDSKSSAITEERFFWTIGSLSQCESNFFEGCDPKDRYVCFADPSNYEDIPGWMLRNLLVLIKQRWRWEEVQIIRYRDVHSERDGGRSIAMKLRTEPSAPVTEMPKVRGWERNAAGKMAGRTIDLKAYMDPE
ncbi:Autophagy protein 7, partial [Ascosphaera aggregata]